MASSRIREWPTTPEASSFRAGRSQRPLWPWLAAAVITSITLHLVLWRFAGSLGLPEYFGTPGVRADEERIPVDLRRARINEEAAVTPEAPPPVPVPVERDVPPPTTEPVDVTQFKELKFDELKMTTEVEVPTNIVASRNPSSGSLDANISSALAAVPVASAGDALSRQIQSATGSLAVDPPVSQDQVILLADELPSGDALGKAIASAAKKGREGVGDEEGFATLDDLLNYSGPMTEDRTAMMPTDLLFEYNSAELKDSARLSLMKLGFIIQKNPEAEISIEGHTDTFGGDAYNIKLSEARAVAVKRWLVDSLRLDAGPLQTRGWGKAKLLVPGGDVAAQQKNRRVEIVIRPRR
jgi:outer membrane protein OmpA-like peptidoglycan-associated protein